MYEIILFPLFTLRFESMGIKRKDEDVFTLVIMTYNIFILMWVMLLKSIKSLSTVIPCKPCTVEA